MVFLFNCLHNILPACLRLMWVVSMRVFIILLLLVNWCYAQSVRVDTAFIHAAKSNAIALYEDRVSEQSHLINGTSYHKVQLLHNNRSKIEEAHPYYSFEWTQGAVLYDGEWYSATLLYDVSSDNLIMQTTPPLRQILLVREKVEEFRLGDRHFVKLSGENSLVEGFYEAIYDNNAKVFVRTKKTFERVVGYDVETPYRYLTKTTHYIKKDGNYYNVNSKGSVLKVFSSQKSQLRAFLRSQSMSFKDNRTFLIGEMARYYDQLEAEK